MTDKQAPKRYHQVKNRIFFLSLSIDFIVLLAFFYSGLSLQLKQSVSQFATNPVYLNALYLVCFSAGLYVIHFPISLFSEFIWEHKFDLSNQDFSAWLKDDLKRALLSLAIFLVLVEVVYVLLGRFPHRWWIGAGAFWLFVTFVLARITPNFIVPLFFKYQEIENEALKKRIFDLFERCKVPLKDVYAIDLSKKTKKANAFLCGVGRNRRVVLSDTLLSNFSDEEIEVVVAHELAHYKHKDIIKLLVINGCVIFLGFYLVHQFFRYAVGAYNLSGLDDIAFLPMVLVTFMLLGLVTTPLLNAFSRWIERNADRFSIETTHQPEVFVSMIRKLGEMNLADFEPSRFIEIFMHDHPPIAKRIAFAENFQSAGAGKNDTGSPS